MIRSAILMIATFYAFAVWANTAGTEVHVNEVYPALSFFAAVVVAVLGWLLKTLVTRDRKSIDDRIEEIEANYIRRMEEMEIAHDKARAIVARQGEVARDDLRRESREGRDELRIQMNGLGVKLEHLADVVDEKVSEAVEELRRHDKDLFEKWDSLNREFGQLKGEHQAMRSIHDQRTRRGD
jgi:hypothetical protein